MTIPWLIGQLFEPIGPAVAMWIIAIDLVAAMLLLIILILYSSRVRVLEIELDQPPVPS